jgi:hypothetical protein
MKEGEKAVFIGETRGATGSDIEQVVLEARVEQLFISGGVSAQPTGDLINKTVRNFKPSAKVMRADLESMRAMFGNAYPVSQSEETLAVPAKNRRAVSINEQTQG